MFRCASAAIWPPRRSRPYVAGSPAVGRVARGVAACAADAARFRLPTMRPRSAAAAYGRCAVRLAQAAAGGRRARAGAARIVRGRAANQSRWPRDDIHAQRPCKPCRCANAGAVRSRTQAGRCAQRRSGRGRRRAGAAERGPVPRAGPFRLHVELAQRLARAACAHSVSTRPASARSRSALQRARRDHCGARRACRTHGARRFVVAACAVAQTWAGVPRARSAVLRDADARGISFTGHGSGLEDRQRARAQPARMAWGLWRSSACRKGGGDGAPAIAEYREWTDRKGHTQHAITHSLGARGLRS